ncbi:MAG: PhoPQ-activated pathogenicity [Bryobacteraceae bacterium]|nr:PhoPQ-activated pathogenicity [Bryobacteraceae bacterium]
MVLKTAILLIALVAAPLAAQETALDRYVREEDATHQWRVAGSVQGSGYTTDVLEVTSQRWLTEAEVDKPVWKHWVVITRPAEVKHRTAVLFIDGGDNTDAAPGSGNPLLRTLALETKAVLVEVKGVPNQPLKFAGDTKAGRSEDAVIAFSWKRYLETGDERWPARLPMTKAVVRAMDAVQAHCATAQGGSLNIVNFIAAGGSKRGWTTWSAAAVDARVVAIIPIVFDALNIEKSFPHHKNSYGTWSGALQDYVDEGLESWFGTESFGKLLEIEDPFLYRERMGLPKFVVNASGDEFFLPDSSRFYWNDLPGEKYLRYVPNSRHSISQEAALDIFAWVDAFLNGRPRPRFYWRLDRASGETVLHALDKPSEVRLWSAVNENARDFRVDTVGPEAWASRRIEGVNGIYRVKPDPPAAGYAAYFLELTFDSGGAFPFRFTTEVAVTPDTLP